MVAIDRDPRTGLNAAVAAELRAAREARGIPIAELARRAHISRSTLIRMLNTERAIGVEPLSDLADALDVPVAELIQRAQQRRDRDEQEAAEADGGEVVQLRPGWPEGLPPAEELAAQDIPDAEREDEEGMWTP